MFREDRLADELARVRESVVDINTIHTACTPRDAVNVLQASAPPAANIPSVQVPVDKFVDSLPFTNLTHQFHEHSLTDRTQLHKKVNMADVCPHLLFPADDTDSAVKSVALRFTLTHNMVVWKYRDSARFYVLKFPVVGALAGNDAVSLHTYLLILAHFGHGPHASSERILLGRPQAVLLMAKHGARHLRFRQRLRRLAGTEGDSFDLSS